MKRIKSIFRKDDLIVFLIIIFIFSVVLAINYKSYVKKGNIFKYSVNAQYMIDNVNAYNSDIDIYLKENKPKTDSLQEKIKDIYSLQMLTIQGTGFHLIGENCKVAAIPTCFSSDLTVEDLKVVSKSLNYVEQSDINKLKDNQWTIINNKVYLKPKDTKMLSIINANLVLSAVNSYNFGVNQEIKAGSPDASKDRLIQDSDTLEMLTFVDSGSHLIGDKCRLSEIPKQFTKDTTIAELKVIVDESSYLPNTKLEDLDLNHWTIADNKPYLKPKTPEELALLHAKTLLFAIESYNKSVDIETQKNKNTIDKKIIGSYTLEQLCIKGTGYHLIGDKCRMTNLPNEFDPNFTVDDLKLIKINNYQEVKKASDLLSGKWTIIDSHIYINK